MLVLLLCLSVASIAKKPDPTWRTGTLVDQSSERHCSTSGHVNNGSGDIDTNCSTIALYKVDAGDMVYTFSRTTFLRRDKPLDVTVNAPIKFFLDGQTAYLQDEQGKQHKVSLVQKAKK